MEGGSNSGIGRVNAGSNKMACWAHCGRKFHDYWVAKRSVVATEAIGRIRAFDAKARFPPPEGRG